MPVQLTLKENVHGLGYKGLDPTLALFGVSGEHINLLDDDFEKSNNLLGDVRNRKGRKLGISGQVKVLQCCCMYYFAASFKIIFLSHTKIKQKFYFFKYIENAITINNHVCASLFSSFSDSEHCVNINETFEMTLRGKMIIIVDLK